MISAKEHHFRPTLDDFFGRDREVLLAELIAEANALSEESQRNLLMPFTGNYLKDLELIDTRITKGKRIVERLDQIYRSIKAIPAKPEKFRTIFFRVRRFIKDYNPSNRPSKIDEIIYKVELFLTLGNWLKPTYLDLKYKIQQESNVVSLAVEDLIARIERFAAFIRIATHHSVLAIRQALVSLRLGSPVVFQVPSGTATLREMIGEMLSSHILAAGGGLGAFIIRI